MAGGTAQIDEAPFSQDYDALVVREDDMVNLWFDVFPGKITDACNINFRVKVADVADDSLVRHLFHVLSADYPDIAGGGNEYIALRRSLVHGDNPVSFHGGLQGTDGINLGDPDRCSHTAQRLGATLAHITVAADNRDLAGDHDVGGSFNPVYQGFATAVEIVKF